MKEIVTYRYGSFNDYKGQEHKVIVCALSTRVNNMAVDVHVYEDEFDDYGVDIDTIKTLSFGVSICNPIDEYSQKHGETIAYNRAKKYTECPLLVSNRAGFFNTFTVDAIANNYLEYIQKDPGSVIDGYDEAKRKFLKEQDLKKEVSKMTDADKAKIRTLANSTTEDIKYAKEIVKFIV